MNALDCTDIKALLSALIDDQIDAHTRHQVERHLAGCETCRAELSEAERLDALIAMSAEVDLHGSSELPRGFEDAVLAETVRAGGRGRSAAAGLALWTGWLAAAASLGLAAVIWMGENPMQTSPIAAVNADQARDHARTPALADAQAQPQTPDTPETEEPAAADRPSSARQYAVLGNLPRLPALGIENWSALPAAHASSNRWASRPAPDLTREEADAIYSVSLLMNVLADADLGSFADVERIRQVIEADELLDWLDDIRERVDPEDRPAILAAESVLVRIVQGPLDREDVRMLSETVAKLDLSEELGRITRRWDAAWSL